MALAEVWNKQQSVSVAAPGKCWLQRGRQRPVGQEQPQQG